MFTNWKAWVISIASIFIIIGVVSIIAEESGWFA